MTAARLAAMRLSNRLKYELGLLLEFIEWELEFELELFWLSAVGDELLLLLALPLLLLLLPAIVAAASAATAAAVAAVRQLFS